MATCDDALRVVLLGKTGAGKSSLGNSLTGNKAPRTQPKDKRDERPPEHKDPNEGFKVGRGLGSETVYCDWRTGVRNGMRVEVTDTPGLCDTHLPEHLIYKEVAKSVAVAEPGPNVIVFVLRCDRRFTEEEYGAYNKVKQLFSDEMNHFLILVFNGLDVYDDVDTIDEQREILSEEITKFGDKLKDMVAQAGGRFFGMNNKASPAERDKQTKDLLEMMMGLVRKNGKGVCYKTEMTEKIMLEVERLAAEESTTKHVSSSQAVQDVKTKIITEKVKPGFWATVTGAVASAAKKVVEGVSSMCSVM